MPLTTPAPYHPRPERWPQVSLRGLLVVVTVACVSLGWLAVQVKWIKDRHDAIYRSPKYVFVHLDWNERGVAPLSLRIFGERGLLRIEIDSDLSAEQKTSERRR